MAISYADYLSDEELMSAFSRDIFSLPQNMSERMSDPRQQTIPDNTDKVVEPPPPASAFEASAIPETLPPPTDEAGEPVVDEPLRMGALDQFKGAVPQPVAQKSEIVGTAPQPEPAPRPMAQEQTPPTRQPVTRRTLIQDQGATGRKMIGGAPNPFEPDNKPKREVVLPATGTPDYAKDLAEFIGGIEAPLGYDQIQGKNKFLPKPASEMTLNEVLAFQDTMRPNGHESSAVGRYQIVQGTLKEIMDRTGMKGTEKFTPEVQDRMFMDLLQLRGLNKYLSGRITDKQFANNLAMEWASLPVVAPIPGKNKTVGQSYYAGVGSNQKLTEPSNVLDMVHGLRDMFNNPADQQLAMNDTGEEEILTPVMNGDQQVMTSEGRPVYQNQWGDQVTERTVTVGVGDKYYNIPTVYDGQFVSEEEAVGRVADTERDGKVFDPITGRELRPFSDLDSAIKSAEERSPTLLTEPAKAEVNVPQPQVPPTQAEAAPPQEAGPDVGSIMPSIETERGNAWENVFNFTQDIGLSRTASQKLADMAAFIADLSPSADAAAISEGSQKITEGKVGEGALDVASGLIPVAGDVGKAIFAGIRSTGAKGPITRGPSRSFTRATKMKYQDKASNEEIRKATGWHQGVDGNWMYEIDDSLARINPKSIKHNDIWKKDELDMGILSPDKTLKDILMHDRLFKEYPDLKDIPVKRTPLFEFNTLGAYDPIEDVLYINPTKPMDEIKGTILHEIQHAIQTREGWAPGGNSGMFKPEGFDEAYKAAEKAYRDFWDKYPQVNSFSFMKAYADMANGKKDTFKYGTLASDAWTQLVEDGVADKALEVTLNKQWMDKIDLHAFKAYEALIGETQARVVTKRMDLSPFERMQTPIEESMSYKPEQQILPPKTQPTWKDWEEVK